jgi:hypothetical protein
MNHHGGRMREFNPKEYSPQELLRCFASILDELKAQKVIRTRNNPVSDYAEWLVAEKLGLKLEPSNTKGYDARSPDCLRYQVKARRLERPDNDPPQLGVIRNLEGDDFDYLVGVLFNNNFGVHKAYLIPHDVISESARFSTLVNGYILQLRGDLLAAPGVEDITHVLCN